VLKACASVNVKDLLGVMVDVSVGLADIIELIKDEVFSSIDGKLVLSLGAVIPICVDLGLTPMIKVLGLGV